ncbi:MAG: hypothetical protein ACK5NN_10390 [Sphingomonadaceae bacterium]
MTRPGHAACPHHIDRFTFHNTPHNPLFALGDLPLGNRLALDIALGLGLDRFHGLH